MPKVRNALNSVACAQRAKLWQAITDWQKATFNLLKCTHSNMEWINSIVESLYVILLGPWLNTSTPHQPSELSVSLNNATTRTTPPQRKPPTDVNTDDLECWWSELKWYTRSFLHEWSLAKEGKGGRVGVEVGGGFITLIAGWTEAVQRHLSTQKYRFPPWKCGRKLMKP